MRHHVQIRHSNPRQRCRMRLLRSLSFATRLSRLLDPQSIEDCTLHHVSVQIRCLCREPPGISRLKDREVEVKLLDRFRELQKRPNGAETAHLFWFLATESEDLDSDRMFGEICDFAATVAGSFNPSEIEMIFRVCLKRLKKPHQALLQTVAEALISSNDLTPFPTNRLIWILEHIARRHKQEGRLSAEGQNYETFFTHQTAFVKLFLEEITAEERLHKLYAADVANAYCSAAVLGLRSTEGVYRLKNRLMEKGIKQGLTAKEVAHVAYTAALGISADAHLVDAMARLYPSKSAEAETEYLGVLLYSIAKCRDRIDAPEELKALCFKMKPEKLRNLRNEDLACLFYSLGKLSIRNEHLLKLLSAEVWQKERLQALGGQQLLSILQAVLDLGYTSDHSLVSAVSHEILVGRDQTTGLSRISQLRTMEICGIMHAWSRMNLHKEWAIQVLLGELVREPRRKDFTAEAAAVTLQSMGLCRLYDEPMMRFLESDWITNRTLKNFDDRLLAMVICGLSRLPKLNCIRPLKTAVREFSKHQRLTSCHSIALVGVLHSVTVSKFEDRPYGVCHSDDGDVRILFDEAVVPHRLKEMSERCLSLILYSLGKAKLSHQKKAELCMPVVTEAVSPQRLIRMDNQALSNILLALGNMDYGYHDHVKTFAWELLKPHRSKGLEAKGFVQLTHTVLALGNLQVKDPDPILDVASAILLRKGVHTVPPVGICLLVTRMSRLRYKNVDIYSVLVKEALRKDRLGLLRPQDLPMIVESIGTLGFRNIFSELVMEGLKTMDDCNKYSLADLKRIQKGLVSMKSIKRTDLMWRIQKRISFLTERSSISHPLAGFNL